MLRRSFALAVVVSVAVLGGCEASSGETEGSSEADIIVSSGPIAESFQADGNENGYLASIDANALPYCMPFRTGTNTTFSPGTFGNVKFGKFTGAAGKNIAYGIYKAPAERAALVLVPGRTEAFAKYCEFIYDMRKSGVSVYAMDLRGQGWSDRLLSDPQKGHIDSFDYYVDDVKTFRDTIVMATPHSKTVLFGHSTGGGASTLYMERYPDDFDAAILSSPMHRIKTARFGEWAASGVTELMVLLRRGDDYAPGKGPYDDNAAFGDNGVEHSPERWANARRFSAAFPETKIGGPTNAWVHQSIAATHAMKDHASQITTPFLLLQALQDDVVVPAGQDEVCAAANANGAVCTKVSFGDPSLSTESCSQALADGDLATADRCAGHELLFERDRIRADVERAISTYVDKLTGISR